MISWHLDLGRVEQHRLAIEPLGRELVLGFEPPIGGTTLSLTRAAIVQPGYSLELPPWLAPARSLILPWAKAPLDDLWLLLYTSARRYWFEVPYGMCRSPGEHGDAPQLGPPRPPPNATSDDVVLPWQMIRFKLGRAGGWQLAVIARQKRAGELELAIHRPDPGIPPAILVTAGIDSRSLAIEQHDAWSAEPAAHHAVRYRFPASPLGTRGYVRLAVKCGAASFDLEFPTSLTDRSHRSVGLREAAP
jgi:hypothetical protein